MSKKTLYARIDLDMKPVFISIPQLKVESVDEELKYWLLATGCVAQNVMKYHEKTEDEIIADIVEQLKVVMREFGRTH